jgi:hypothetical protein
MRYISSRGAQKLMTQIQIDLRLGRHLSRLRPEAPDDAMQPRPANIWLWTVRYVKKLSFPLQYLSFYGENPDCCHGFLQPTLQMLTARHEYAKTIIQQPLLSSSSSKGNSNRLLGGMGNVTAIARVAVVISTSLNAPMISHCCNLDWTLIE